MRWLVCSSLLLITACTRNEPAHQVESAPVRAPDGARVEERKPSAAAEDTRGPLSVELVPETHAEGIGLRVLSRGVSPVELAEFISAKRVDDAESNAQALRLRLDCAQQGCVKLAPGSELMAPSWLGLVEGERCDARFRPQKPGEYVLTVRSCDGKQSADVRVRWAAP